jgi:hypothetical protein
MFTSPVWYWKNLDIFLRGHTLLCTVSSALSGHLPAALSGRFAVLVAQPHHQKQR